ncbi:hypothetical protein MMC07_007065 [Pseudocyphellaria aurata]|nr:hypothetical protein [Pseudocyphellaria aurata]
MSSSGENLTRIEDGNLDEYAFQEDSHGMPREATRTASSQALALHQTSGAQVQGHAVGTEMEDTVHNPKKNKGTIKRASTRGGRAIKMIPGFEHWSTPLPRDLQHEDIIKRYPNHLRGELLLEIAATWTPKEISRTCGRPELRANTLLKRIIAAKRERDGLPKRSHKSASKTPKPACPPSGSAIASGVQPYQTTDFPETFAESEASRNFLVEQTELRDIMVELDPDWSERNSNGQCNKNPARDRQLLELAVQERQRRMGLA